MNKTILYWSPCLNKVGTVKSTINSAISIKKFSKKKEISVKIINLCGEWNEYRFYLLQNNIEILDIGFNFFHLLPKNGFLASRFSYLVMIFTGFLPLLKLIYKFKPDFIILHLLTSLPLILLNLFSFDSKFVLRISGNPKLNFFRNFLWKLSSRKIFKITCPTIELLNDLKKKNIFPINKLFFLPDAIINISEFSKKIQKKDNILTSVNISSNFFLSIGRLTKQKNFLYLINEYSKFAKENNYIDLLIIGDGEEKQELIKLIKKKKIENRVFIIGFTNNVEFFMKRATAFILSSLWEEVGFVIVEAALSNLFVISSDCPNGPVEFLLNGQAGNIFSSNIENALYNELKRFSHEDFDQLYKKKIIAKKQAKTYTIFNHYKTINEIIN